MVTVKYFDLYNAVEFASMQDFDASAYVHTVTGETYLVSSDIDEEFIPDDIETSDKYLAVPAKRDLDLGKWLVLSFVAAELPDDYDTVENYFRKRGAYSRFKDFLAAKGALQKWYEYEENATKAALRKWCEENGLELSFAETGPREGPVER